jgi:hypothetical protein
MLQKLARCRRFGLACSAAELAPRAGTAGPTLVERLVELTASIASAKATNSAPNAENGRFTFGSSQVSAHGLR